MILIFVGMAEQIVCSFPSVRIRCRDKFRCSRTIFKLGRQKNTRQAVYFIFLFRIGQKFVRIKPFRIAITVYFSIWYPIVRTFSCWKFKFFPGLQISVRRCFCSSMTFSIFSCATFLRSTYESSVRFRLDSKINHSNSANLKIDMSS